MKAMIFAAGLGTRLRPLTDHCPKALVPVAGSPMLEHVITRLIKAGFNELVINIHHHGEQIISYLNEHSFPGTDIRLSDERDLLLDTGGGIWKARHLLEGDEPFLIHNVDILSDIDLKAFYQQHLHTGAEASLPTLTLPYTIRWHSEEYTFSRLLCSNAWKPASGTGVFPSFLSTFPFAEKQ